MAASHSRQLNDRSHAIADLQAGSIDCGTGRLGAIANPESERADINAPEYLLTKKDEPRVPLKNAPACAANSLSTRGPDRRIVIFRDSLLQSHYETGPGRGANPFNAL